MTRENAFPTTHLTWLQTHVGTGETAAARAESANKARQFVMERYAEPLAVFVRGSSLGRVSETSEIVNGFFASRLSDGAFLEAWSSSGMRLRRWLMNGILFYGQGLIRDSARSATRSTSVDPRELDRRVALNSFGEIDFEKHGRSQWYVKRQRARKNNCAERAAATSMKSSDGTRSKVSPTRCSQPSSRSPRSNVQARQDW